MLYMSGQNQTIISEHATAQSNNTSEKANEKDFVKLYQTISLWIIGVLTIGISIFFTYWAVKNLDLRSGEGIKWDTTGQVGDFFGGVIGTLVAAFGSILIYMSFRAQSQAQQKQHQQFEATSTAQKKTDADQRTEFMKAQIENRFIALIQLHKENLKFISFETEEKKYFGREAISKIVEHIELCYKEIEPFFTTEPIDNIYISDYKNVCSKILSHRNSLDLIKMAQLEIAYCFVFFGTNVNGMQPVLQQFDKYYNSKFITRILAYLYLKPHKTDQLILWRKVSKELGADDLSKISEDHVMKKPSRVNTKATSYEEDLKKLLKNIDTQKKFYNGIQDNFGHYFRHLFQSVRYINKQNILNYEEKYNYVKTLRAQLSTVEQYLIFYNSISFMGREWEFKHIPMDSPNPDWDLWLFTKYNFIKNIPIVKMITTNIDISTYYPDVHFEFEDEPIERRFLIEKFN